MKAIQLIWITKLTTAPDDEIFIGRSGIFNQVFDAPLGGRFSDAGGPMVSGGKTWLIKITTT
jgi:hypothetical protein